jgi:hypothetical protein
MAKLAPRSLGDRVPAKVESVAFASRFDSFWSTDATIRISLDL